MWLNHNWDFDSYNFDFISHNCDFISCSEYFNLTIYILLYITIIIYIPQCDFKFHNWVKIFRSVILFHKIASLYLTIVILLF